MSIVPSTLWLASLALGFAVAVAVAVWHAGIVQRGVDAELDDGRSLPARAPAFQVLYPLVLAFEPLAKRVAVPAYRASTRTALVRAGLNRVLSVDEFLAFKGACGLASIGLAVGLSEPAVPLLPVIGALGTFYPDVWVRERVRQRQARLLLDLPFFVDCVSLCVQAGLDFAGSLRRVVPSCRPGPLREELQQTLSDVTLGTTRKDALRALAFRAERAEVQAFTGLLVQAEELGTSIAETLADLARRMRAERLARAEKAGAVLSQKIMVPMVFFLLPACMIVMFGPAVLTLIERFQ